MTSLTWIRFKDPQSPSPTRAWFYRNGANFPELKDNPTAETASQYDYFLLGDSWVQCVNFPYGITYEERPITEIPSWN